MSRPGQKMLLWINERLPVIEFWQHTLSRFYVPKNFNLWYVFGAILVLVLANQIVTGVWLAMFYTPTAEGAFASVEYIMRDVNYGWLLRYMHSTGASAFFIALYLHMFRALIYASYQRPRELVWLIGMGIYLALMAEAFMGYLLPWGQMSYWGAQVITSLFGAIPGIGPALVEWIRGDYMVSGATLNRFFALHVIAVPLVILLLVWLHIAALHHVGSNNPDGVDIREDCDAEGIPRDGIPFHPYYTVKDLFGIVVFLIVFATIIFFFPTMGGYFLEANNFIPANPMQTPAHISPVWYLTPYYAMLRAIPDKLMGVMTMASAIAILFTLPWLDKSKVKSIRYRGWYFKIALAMFIVAFIGLGYLGTLEVDPLRNQWARIFTVIYFLFFLAMPFYTRWDKNKPVPQRVRMR